LHQQENKNKIYKMEAIYFNYSDNDLYKESYEEDNDYYNYPLVELNLRFI